MLDILSLALWLVLEIQGVGEGTAKAISSGCLRSGLAAQWIKRIEAAGNGDHGLMSSQHHSLRAGVLAPFIICLVFSPPFPRPTAVISGRMVAFASAIRRRQGFLFTFVSSVMRKISDT